ncbi:hypothetical protein M3J09_011385 [Ascochyta lentis]
MSVLRTSDLRHRLMRREQNREACHKLWATDLCLVPSPFRYQPWSVLGRQLSFTRRTMLGCTYLEGPRTVGCPLSSVACCPELEQ